MRHCPFWVLGVVSIFATRQYVNGQLPLLAYASKYSLILSDFYDDVSKRKLMLISEEVMNFLVEVDAENILDIFDSYIFFKTTFDEAGELRKMKTFFKSALSSVPTDTTVEDILRSFKVFTYRYRSNDAMAIPIGWELPAVEKIGWLGELFEQEITLNGSLDLD
jgi:hypothetical protein